MDKSRVFADLGLITETMVGDDLFNPVHIRYTAVLDHEINDKIIVKAWDRTKRVFPVVDTVLEAEHGGADFYMKPENSGKYTDDHLYLIKPESGSNVPIKTKIPVSPGSDVVGGRVICVSYYGNTIALSMYHAAVDAGGFKMIASTFLYIYLALYTGHEDENPPVELTEGREPKEYYQPISAEYVYKQEYNPVLLYTLPTPCRGFYDDDMVREDGHVYSGGINVSVKDFIGFCKKNGANPSAMMCTLLAKAAYALNPDEKRGIVFDLTISARKVLGFENNVANVIGLSTSYISREDVMNKTIAEISQNIRSDLERQRTRDYILSLYRFFHAYEHIPLVKSRTVTYMGALDIGDNNSHILDFSMETNSIYNLFMFQLNDNFALTLQYGKATEKYLNELDKIFSELGIKAEITHLSHIVENDVTAAVL